MKLKGISYALCMLLSSCSVSKMPPPAIEPGDSSLEKYVAHSKKVDGVRVFDYKKVTDKSTSSDWEIYKEVNGAITRLTENSYEDIYPDFDGKVIVFERRINKKTDVYSMDINGNNLKKLTEKGNNFYPRISPNSSKIAFVSDRDGNDEVYIMNIDGSMETRITFDEGRDGKPKWLDDKTIMYRNGEGPYTYIVIDSDGNEETVGHDW